MHQGVRPGARDKERSPPGPAGQEGLSAGGGLAAKPLRIDGASKARLRAAIQTGDNRQEREPKVG